MTAPGAAHEHEPRGIEVELAVEPGLALAQDVGTVLLDRVPDPFLRVIRRDRVLPPCAFAA